MGVLPVPSNIQELINEFENNKEIGEIKPLLYVLNRICKEFEKLLDWDHVLYYAKDGLEKSHKAGLYKYEAAFKNYWVLYSIHKKDKDLLIKSINDQIIAKEQSILQIIKNKGMDSDDSEIRIIRNEIGDLLLILFKIQNQTFDWASIS